MRQSILNSRALGIFPFTFNVSLGEFQTFLRANISLVGLEVEYGIQLLEDLVKVVPRDVNIWEVRGEHGFSIGIQSLLLLILNEDLIDLDVPVR